MFQVKKNSKDQFDNSAMTNWVPQKWLFVHWWCLSVSGQTEIPLKSPAHTKLTLECDPNGLILDFLWTEPTQWYFTLGCLKQKFFLWFPGFLSDNKLMLIDEYFVDYLCRQPFSGNSLIQSCFVLKPWDIVRTLLKTVDHTAWNWWPELEMWAPLFALTQPIWPHFLP